MNKKQLWLKIANYHFEHLVATHLWDDIISKFGGENPSSKAFADKLSRKLNWSKKFASKAIWEYKKFVYLGVISDFSITPSKIIDQVWHEHLLFSAGYRKFCKDVIEYDFDHNPELIPFNSQTETFHSQYFHTIELYKTEFGIAPPAEIWEETKFKGNIKKKENQKNNSFDAGFSNYIGTNPLISMFPDSDVNNLEFGNGEFGGGGGTGNFEIFSSDSGDSSSCGSSCSSSCGSSCGGD